MKAKNLIKDGGGFISILLALGLMAAIFFFGGLAIDVGRAYVVRGELQRAADAGALAGVGVMYPATSSTPLAQLTPDWNSIELVARDFVKQNNADGAKLSETDIVRVETGYWSLKQTPPGIQPQTTIPTYQCSVSGVSCTPNSLATSCSINEVCLQQDVPAVRVTVQKAGGVAPYFTKIAGWNLFSPSATAVAARGNPLSASIGFPFAVTKCMTEYYLSHNLTGQTIDIPGIYLPNCNTGNWTSLTGGGNGDRVVSELLHGSPPVPLDVGSNIEIQTGIRANLYAETESYIGKTVFIPVVADNLVSINSGAAVSSFIAFQVTAVQTTGTNKHISGIIVPYHTDITANHLGGSQGNTVTPPVLIK